MVVLVAASDEARTADPAPPDPTPSPEVPEIDPYNPSQRRGAARFTEGKRTPDDFSKPWWHWKHATGDWGRARPWLLGHGVIPELLYTIQLFSNVHGGLTTDGATHASATLDAAVTFDTERLGLWSGGTLFVLLQDSRGRGVAQEVGSIQPIGTLDRAGDFTRLAALSYEQRLLDDRLGLRIGKTDANAAFADSIYTALFLNGGISPPQNLPMPTYPNQALGFEVGAAPIAELRLAAGVYGAELEESSLSDAGLFEGNVFVIAEVAWAPQWRGHEGLYQAGAWLSTLDTERVGSGPAPELLDHSYGFYVLLDQVVYLEGGDARGEQGLGLWFQLSWAPSDRSVIDLWVGGGLVYTGPVPGRDEDLAGFAVTSADVSPDPNLSAPGAELTLEWFYLMRLTPWLQIQPDIQLIVNPGGRERDALVLGAEWVVRF